MKAQLTVTFEIPRQFAQPPKGLETHKTTENLGINSKENVSHVPVVVHYSGRNLTHPGSVQVVVYDKPPRQLLCWFGIRHSSGELAILQDKGPSTRCPESHDDNPFDRQNVCTRDVL
jgi:hypothetical protein